MQAAQTSGIDLALKALIWQDASGATWLSYNDPAWIAKRHGLRREAEGAGQSLVRRSVCVRDGFNRSSASLKFRTP
ncbi:MAG TPA: DUF302 domain-containing protein [Bradyrhizobium sp.]|nr:DUF302 domain-containing protein [Bradyrhizobium sp.]